MNEGLVLLVGWIEWFVLVGIVVFFIARPARPPRHDSRRDRSSQRE